MARDRCFLTAANGGAAAAAEEIRPEAREAEQSRNERPTGL